MLLARQYPTYKLRTITCIRCGETVTGRMPPNRKYCSSKCWIEGSRSSRKTGEDRACEQCGVVKYFPKHRLKIAKNNFCSLKCANIWQGRHKVEKICIICGDLFKLSPSWETFHGGLYCSNKCRYESPIEKQRMLDMNIKQQRGKNPNKLECAGEKILNDMKISFIPQVLIANKFLVDAFIPILGVVIQWDGDYWHGYSVPDGHSHPEARIRKRMRLDKSQDAYMKECGYTVLRFWEHEVFSEAEKVSKRIRAAI